jgi:hypothetical protein
VVSGGLACVGGALLLGALIPAVRHATLRPLDASRASVARPVPEAGPVPEADPVPGADPAPLPDR